MISYKSPDIRIVRIGEHIEGLAVSAELKPCPFCGKEARMECNRRGNSGGLKRLVLYVQHDASCILRDYSEIVFGFIDFDTESDAGKSALMGLEHEFARSWNRRDGA